MKTFITRIVISFVLLISANIHVFAQQLNPECSNILGQVYSTTAGNFNCSPFALNPAIPAGTTANRCFSFQYMGPIRLSFIIVTGSCGPFPLYNQLSFTIYNSTCDSIVHSGSIIPTNVGTYIDFLVPGEFYIICYQWDTNCDHTAACPIIFTSLLPIELLYFDAEYDTDTKCTVLSWSTATETNSDYFIIKKSYDLVNYVDEIRIQAKGNSNTVSDYMALNCDDNERPTVYYKLIEVDRNGNQTDYDIQSVNVDIQDNQVMEIYDITGRKIDKLQNGINIIKKDNKYYKIVKLN